MSQGISLATRAAPSVRGLHALLVDAIKRAQQYHSDQDLRKALKSQGGIAKLERAVTDDRGDTLQVIPMSLNTLKTYADAHLPGGFKALNDLRLKALEALEIAAKRGERSNKRTRSGLSLKVAELEHELELHRQTNMLLLKAIAECHEWFYNIRDASSALQREKDAQDAADTVRAVLSMAMPPFNTLHTVEVPSPSAEVPNIADYRKD
ncbi:hypothetical protein NC656_01295 [Pseudomonas asiatica]|uniref:hypothetical protein n=1 Tax=Pseudomonas TaxID=286 RepID=UPI0010467988|nr:MULTISPECIES: hypothetical protein [Pseudomonas]MCO8260185.1 hypothetical protein [Pseudomonas asiatica]TCP75878.1 hypothetical protein EC849_107141 [Pseudomonas putida]